MANRPPAYSIYYIPNYANPWRILKHSTGTMYLAFEIKKRYIVDWYFSRNFRGTYPGEISPVYTAMSKNQVEAFLTFKNLVKHYPEYLV